MKNEPVAASARISVPITAPNRPSRPSIIGRIHTVTMGKTRLLKKDKIADTKPLFNAVKNAEAKILNPESKNETE